MRMDVVILGATGSVGRQTAEVIRAHPDRLYARGLVAHRQVDEMVKLVAMLNPEWVAMTDPESQARLSRQVSIPVLGSMEAVEERLGSLPHPTGVVAAMSGFAGLRPALAGARAGHRICLANKETLVAAGALLTAAVKAGGGMLLPVDSEHSALMQCLGSQPNPFRRLILTCSGGPFRGLSRDDLVGVTARDALKHPTWNMGAKITIDSATLMNKGLEVLEAHWLFNTPLDKIDVVVHPESVVHSMVEFVDGSVLAQLGVPDMRVPIQVALSWPERWELDVPRLDLARLGSLHFEDPDVAVFPSLALARAAGEMGGTAPCVLNAANEVAVGRFLEGDIGFLDIARLVEEVLGQRSPESLSTLDEVLEADRWARSRAQAWQGGRTAW